MPTTANTPANPEHAAKIAERIDAPAAPPVDPEAEWDQRMLQGMKHMDEDPEFRAFVEKRIS